MQNTQLSTKRFDTVHTVEVTEDFNLPDYIPEVRRVVGVRAVSTVDGKYLNGEVLEADGGVQYTVLYLGGDGGLSSVPLTTAYEARIPVKSGEGDVFGTDALSLAGAPENVTCRVTAPRRLTLSSKVKLRLFSQKPWDCVTVIAPAELSGTVRTRTEKTGAGYLRTLRYNGECGGEIREREGTRVISAEGCVNINEARPTEGGIAVSGEARMHLLLLTPDGAYTTAKSRAGVEVTLPWEGETVPLQAAAYGRCLLCEIEGAEDGTIGWTMEYDIDCDVMCGGEAVIAVDGYSTVWEEIPVFTEGTALLPGRAVNGRLTVQGSKQIRPGMQYAGGWGRGVLDRFECQNGRTVLSGNVYLTAVLCGEGEAVGEECVIPVKYECDGMEGVDTLAGKGELCVCDITGRADGETLSLTAELGVNGVFLGERSIRCLTGVTLNEEAPVTERKNVITIAIPGQGETEWDIMKRYHAADAPKRHAGGVYLL